MGFNCGIVGLPNVGKSTLFNALTKSEILAANYPFATIEPNNGIVLMPDNRLEEIAKIVKPEKILPTTMEFVDIAGLVEGASKGEGLGNKFLANIRETDAIAHVVRCFDDDNIIHVSGTVDPRRDIEIINLELIMSDLESCQKQMSKVSKQAKSGDKKTKIQEYLLKTLIDAFEEGKVARYIFQNLNDTEKQIIKTFNLITSKPLVYIANIQEDGFENNKYLDVVNEIAKNENAKVVAICSQMESDIAMLDNEEEKKEFLATMNLTEPGLNRVIQAGYEILNLQTYFTAGVKEVRAWSFLKGSTAPKAASVIHTDFEKGFIRAECIAYDDFIKYKGESGSKEAGKWRLEGKDYVVKDSDILHFRFNV